MFLILLFPPYYPNHFAALPPNHPLSLIKKCWLILLYDNCQHLIQSFAFHKCYWWTILSCCLSPYINSPHPFLIHLYMSFFDLWCSYLVPDYILNHCYWCFFWFSSTNHLRCYLYYFFKGWWLMIDDGYNISPQQNSSKSILSIQSIQRGSSLGIVVDWINGWLLNIYLD